MAQFAVGKNLIVAWPQGVGVISSWNFTRGSADVAFLRALVADISATWCVDRHHVHAEGISNGALMVERLACDAADLFASVAPDAGGPPNFTGSPCTPSRPIGVGIFESLLDPLSSPFVAGIASRQLWLGLDGCPPTPRREPGVLLEASTYGPCHGGVEVVYRVYLLETHNFPVGADHTDILNRMWALFRDNPLP
jgi:polyhydroxybutyrate depolymerase